MAWLKLGIIEQNHYRWEKASLKYLMRLNFDQLTPRQISDSLKFMRNWTRSRLPSNTQEKRLKPVVHTWAARSLLANLLYRLGGRHNFVEALTHLNMVISNSSSSNLKKKARILSAEIRQSMSTRLFLVQSSIQ